MDISANANEVVANEVVANEVVANEVAANEVVANEVVANEVVIDTNLNINLLKQYIHALVVNITRENIPSSFNLIFDSGAVNGIMGIGAALYINILEKMGYFNIKKVSGCSIGSFIALWYIYGCPEEFYNQCEHLLTYYKKHKNFYIYENIVKDIVYKLIPDENMSKINERLYINYYDTKKSKNRVISHFENRDHLITCILRSSHVPFLTTIDHKYQGRYIDGIVPYIFCDDDSCKNLFIKLINFTEPLKCLKANNEENIYSRLLRGIVGVNDFFVNGQSDLCSYIDGTCYLNILTLYARKQIVFLVLLLIDLVLTVKKHIPLCVQETYYYKQIILLSKSCWHYLQNNLV